MFQNNFNRLPFDPQNQQFQINYYNPNNPPLNLTGLNELNVVPELRNLINPLVAAVANAASESSGKNPARMFTFNQLANNGFNNQDFVNAVKIAYDFLLFNIKENPNADYNQALAVSANSAISLLASNNVLNQYQEIRNYINPQILNDFLSESSNIVNTGSAIINKVKFMMNSLINNNNNNFNNNFNNNPFNSRSNSFNNNGFNNNGFSNNQSSINNGSIAASFLVNSNNNNVANNNFDTILTKANMGQQQNPQVNVAPQQQNVVNEEKELSIKDWKPSTVQFYLPAHNTKYEKLIFKKVDASNVGYVIALVVPKDETDMDYNSHKIGSIFAIINESRFKDEETREETLEKKLTEKENIKLIINKNTFENNKNVDIVESTEEMINTCVLNHVDKNSTLVEKEVFTVNNFCKVTPIITGSHPVLKDFYKEFKTTGADLKRVKNVLKTYSNKKITELNDVIYQLDKYLTDKINYVLSETMGLGNSIILDSFCDDIDLLQSALTEHHGITFADAFQNYQEKFFEKYLNFIDDEDMADILNVWDVEATTTELFPIVENTSVIYIDVDIEELNIDLKLGTIILSSNKRPQLFTLCREFIKQSEFDTFLIVTKDKKIIDVNNSIIGENGILINLFK